MDFDNSVNMINERSLIVPDKSLENIHRKDMQLVQSQGDAYKER